MRGTDTPVKTIVLALQHELKHLLPDGFYVTIGNWIKGFILSVWRTGNGKSPKKVAEIFVVPSGIMLHPARISVPIAPSRYDYADPESIPALLRTTLAVVRLHA